MMVLLKLRKGAEGARGDDANSLKAAVVNWLNEVSPCPTPSLNTTDKSERGFYHDVTGQLLCPVDYDWLDVSYV